jgi:acyl-CoA synthetase (AMP-forming)/AMP-acid ligase II
VALGPIQQRIEALRLELQIIAGDAVVCDLPDERAGSRLVLAVGGIPAVDAARLREALNLHLRAFEQLQSVVALAQIPRGDLGKVRLEELRSLLA